MSAVKEIFVNEKLDKADQEFYLGMLNRDEYISRLLSLGFSKAKAIEFADDLEEDRSSPIFGS